MKAAITILPVLLMTCFLAAHPAYGWDCSVALDGPTWVKIGRTIQLTASGLPEGGQYSWSSSPYLVPSGSTATLAGFQPTYSDYIRVTVRYTTPKGHSCSDIKWVYAHACEVQISGPSEAQVGAAVNLAAETDCEGGGTFAWSGAPELVADGAVAVFTPQEAGEYDISVTYTLPGGGTADATHHLVVKGCTVSVAGPSEMDRGEALSVVAEGTPAGGSYEWSSQLDLQAQGETTEVFGSAAGEFPVTVTYTLNDANSTSCEEIHLVKVRDCGLQLESLSVAAVGAPTLCAANGLPEGGSCTWSSPAGLLEQIMSAQYTAQEPGLQTFEAEYTTPEGEVCSGTFDTTFIKVGSLTSPYACVNSGETLEKGSFVVVSEPPGYFDSTSWNLSITPLTLTTFLSTSDETITASISSSSILDDSTTKIMVVNKDNKQSVSVNLEIPNYVNDTLKMIGVGDRANLNLDLEFSRFNECCSRSAIKESVDGSTSLSLSVDAGPFTIIGIPLPKKIKDYVTLDALAVTVAGSLKGDVNGDYNGCQNSTQWSGSGGLEAGIDVGGEVKAKSPGEVIVIQGSLKGSTGVKETITFKSSKMELSGSWDGLTVAGEISIKVLNKFKVAPEKVSHVVFEERDLPVASFELPSLKL
jgi:hypothetical protein